MDMEEQLERLERMSRGELQEFWKEHFGGDEPETRAVKLLRRQIVWKLQENEHGGVKVSTHRRLLEMAKSFDKDVNYNPKSRPTPQSGTTLTRNWKGTIHTVKVQPDGFIYKGQHYKGLSKIAREITGTRWSGPLFFGLRKPPQMVRVVS